MRNTVLPPGSRQSSLEVGSGKDHACTVGHWNVKHAGARNISKITSPHSLLLQETENTSNDSTPSILSNQITIFPPLVASSVWEDGHIWDWIAVVGYKGVDCNNTAYWTASDPIKSEGCLREPESAHVKSIFLWNGKTRFIAHCTWSSDMRWSWGIALNMSTHQLLGNIDFHWSTTSHLTQTTPQCSTDHNSSTSQSCDRACEGAQQDGNNRPIYGSFSPTSRTGGAGCPNEGTLASTGITILQNLQARDRLGYRLIIFIKNPEWPRGGMQIRYDNALVWRSGWWKY